MLLPFQSLFFATCLCFHAYASQQHLLSQPHRHPDRPDNLTAPFIFNSLASLLIQWPNTYHGNGHTIIPGIIKPYTLLYHARKDANLPPSPEWFAFDPEMSFGIMGGRGGSTFMSTYRTVRPARVVYFDGMSAALSDLGWLDSQEVFLAGRGRANESDQYPSRDEYTRITKLCKWAETVDLDGFVRMNAGFEVMWCDFDSPVIQLVSHLNITAPGSTPTSGRDMPPPGGGRTPGKDAPDRPTRGRPGGSRPPFNFGWSPLGATGFSEWLRVAAQRGTIPQPHVELDYSSFVTFYHPRLQSLVKAREGQSVRQHRIWNNISTADAQSIRDEVEETLQRPPWRRGGSGMDWGALARNVVEEWASRIIQLHEFIGNTSTALREQTPLNTTQAVIALRRLTYSPLNPFMDTGAPNSTAHDWVYSPGASLVDNVFLFPPRHPLPSVSMNSSALQRCVYSATGFLHDPRIHKTPQEVLLQTSIETVLERLCGDYAALFVESMDVDDRISSQDLSRLINLWGARVDLLMQWLDWTEWHRCTEVCPLDSICSMPMWPLSGFRRGPRGEPGDGGAEEPEDAWKPRCLSLLPDRGPFSSFVDAWGSGDF
ncbi:uncharacterized protein FIBRA_05832 [Fibroporia radiculosa]|uniref:Uncharacterized protein n=1 Tax=Fibroporia radiculosa TaxID=599839 RepID=J4GA68_9APHY|nr:uncharacterized protein FIBRA_05832 [Fibroporia radiculosa]CCM03688.1 predicted protein [Fibroporia radiculosa]